MFKSTKTYGHELGLSVAFRQWNANSHCSLIHGYALSFRFEFSANKLDAQNWVVDFGSLKTLKHILEETFDHKTIIAEDDPQLEYFREGDALGILNLVILPAVSCEKFAEHVFMTAEKWMLDKKLSPRCQLESVEVREHGANSAIYLKNPK